MVVDEVVVLVLVVESVIVVFFVDRVVGARVVDLGVVCVVDEGSLLFSK